MMKSVNLKTKIFLDSGDPQETKVALELLGFLDGQTTNPSLIAKSPGVVGKKFSKEEVLEFYKGIVREVSSLIPKGSVSVEVAADRTTSAEQMFEQGKEFFKWTPNAHIKYPTTTEGLKAAEMSVREGMRVNMTLVFSQEQAAAVLKATEGAARGDVFISPFVGRLDDIGENGMDLISNIVKLYADSDHHVEVLSASVRSLDHFLASIFYGADIITAPLKVLQEWAAAGMPVPGDDYIYTAKDLRPIVYQPLSLAHSWQEYNNHHELTDKGLERFAQDWDKLIQWQE